MAFLTAVLIESHRASPLYCRVKMTEVRVSKKTDSVEAHLQMPVDKRLLMIKKNKNTLVKRTIRGTRSRWNKRILLSHFHRPLPFVSELFFIELCRCYLKKKKREKEKLDPIHVQWCRRRLMRSFSSALFKRCGEKKSSFQGIWCSRQIIHLILFG